MANVRVERQINGDSQKVWDLMSDFGGLASWNPQIDSCEVAGQGVGAVRTLSMGGLVIKERLESIDAASRKYSYAIIEGPVPATGYLATVQISDAGSGKTTVLWTSEFEPAGAPEEDLVKLFEGVYQGGIQAAEKAVA
jgi:carbon monoxide dehydrogenase subunit G